MTLPANENGSGAPEARPEPRGPRVSARATAALVAAVTGAYAAAALLSEKIPDNGGLGIDGMRYGEWVRTLPAALLNKELDAYTIQRVVPSLLVKAALAVLRIEPVNGNVIAGFVGCGIALVAFSAWCWSSIASRLGLSTRARLFGAVALFGTYGVLKWTTYYPVLTDLSSVAISLAMLASYLRGRVLPLAALTVVGAFTWPTTSVVGATLVAFLPPPEDDVVPEGNPRPPRALLFGLALVSAAAWVFLCVRMMQAGYSPRTGTEEIMRPLVRLSIVFSTAFVFASVWVLADDARLFRRATWRRHLARPHPFLGAALWATTFLVRHHFAPNKSPYDLHDTLFGTAFTALLKPGLFLVAHVLFFGPALLVILLRPRLFAAAVRAHGLGLVLVSFLWALLFLNSESRHHWNLAVLFVPFAVKVLDELPWTNRDFATLGGLTLLSSNVWLWIQEPVSGAPREFPGQLLFMTDGPWMNFTMYLVQGLAVGGFAWWLSGRLPPNGAGRALTLEVPSEARLAERSVAFGSADRSH